MTPPPADATVLRPPTHPHDLAKVRAAAHTARTVLAGPIGDYLHRELTAWCRDMHRFDLHGQGPAVAAHIERLAHAQLLGRRP